MEDDLQRQVGSDALERTDSNVTAHKPV